MKFLFLNGSPKKDGTTARVMKQLRDAIAPEHIVEWVDVYGLAVKPCLGCFRCRPDKACGLPEDDAHRIGRKIAEADGLVVGSPNYWGNMSGPLKTLLDRNVTVFETFADGPFGKPLHRGKTAVIVTASGSPWPLNQLPSQSRGTVRAVRTVLTKGGFKIADVIYCGGVRDEMEVPGHVRKKSLKLGRRISG